MTPDIMERDRIGAAVSRLRGLRQEVRLKAHLARIDARDAWREVLQPRLVELEERLRAELRCGSGAQLQPHQGPQELDDRWEELAPQLEAWLDRLRPADGQRLRELLSRAEQALRNVIPAAQQRGQQAGEEEGGRAGAVAGRGGQRAGRGARDARLESARCWTDRHRGSNPGWGSSRASRRGASLGSPGRAW